MQTTQKAALTNLALETVADRHAVTALKTTNATLTAQLQTAITTIAMLQTRINGCRCATPPMCRQQTTHRKRIPLEPKHECVPLDPTGYWHTHRYLVRFKHNSGTCNKRAPGHQDAATRANTMGGSIHNKPEWKPTAVRETLDSEISYKQVVTQAKNTFPSFLFASSTHAITDYGITGHYITDTTPCVTKWSPQYQFQLKWQMEK